MQDPISPNITLSFFEENRYKRHRVQKEIKLVTSRLYIYIYSNMYARFLKALHLLKFSLLKVIMYTPEVCVVDLILSMVMFVCAYIKNEMAIWENLMSH